MIEDSAFGARLAEMPAGPELGALLSSLDLAAVPNDSVIDVLQAAARQRAHVDGLYLAAIASVLHRAPGAGAGVVALLAEPDRYASDEVRAALVKTRRAAAFESEFAYALCRSLPAVHAQMLAGCLDWGRALVFAQHLAGLPAELVAGVLEVLLPEAPGLTTGQLRARILKLIITADPERARDAYERALAERAVVGYLDPDGTAVISASGLPPDEAAAATDRIARLARAVKRSGHPGRVDQLRADIYLRLLDGRFHHLTRSEMIAALLAEAAPCPAGPTGTAPTGTARVRNLADAHPDGAEPEGVEPDGGRLEGVEPLIAEPDLVEPREAEPDRIEPVAVLEPAAGEGVPAGQVVGIEVRARLDSLAGVNELPGELPGWGPILASVARRAVARQHHGQWRWAVTDRDGYLVAEGTTRRRPATGPPGHLADRGIVELAVPATVLARLSKDPPPAWAGVIADIAAQYERARANLDTRPGRRFPGLALRRYVQIRDRTCSAPGCRCPATQSEQDHTRDHRHGGPTTSGNLGPGCSYDHQLKHRGGWKVTQPRPGRFIWTSPLGRHYPTRGERITDPEEPPEDLARS